MISPRDLLMDRHNVGELDPGNGTVGSYRRDFLGYPVDALTANDFARIAEEVVRKNEYCFVGVQNANKMYLSRRNKELEDAISSAKVILPENAINLGMRFLGKPLPERNMGGVVMMERLLRLADSRLMTVFLVGATKDVLGGLAERIAVDFPGVRLLGAIDGYFGIEETESVVQKVSQASPNFLFVGMGSPKQELFIVRNLSRLKANLCMGVGGSFKVLAGLEKPAPRWTKYGMEWIYRSIQDPKKLKRYLVINSYFAYRFFRYLLLGK